VAPPSGLRTGKSVVAIHPDGLSGGFSPEDAPAALDEADLIELLERLNRSGRDALIVPGEYLEAVVTSA